MKRVKEALSRDEVKFWMPIIGIIVSFIISIFPFFSKVEAIEGKYNTITEEIKIQESKCDANHKMIDENLLEIKVKLAEIQKDILYIKKELK